MVFRFTATGSLVFLCLGAWHYYSQGQPHSDSPPPTEAKKTSHPTHIRTPSGPPTVMTAQVDFHGKAAEVGCNTCHIGRVPKLATNKAEDLKDFHQGLKYHHGGLTCLSCHHAEDYESLRFADGRKTGFPQVMDLCRQCHGPQARDYDHGAHGGMTGYWDLSRGSRQRNNCIDCHDPHSPAIPKVRPVFAPKDRFPPRHAKEDHR